jgi:hypothetical protein
MALRLARSAIFHNYPTEIHWTTLSITEKQQALITVWGIYFQSPRAFLFAGKVRIYI